MKLNSITTGIELAGTTVKNLYVKNNIVDIEYEGERNFGMNINEPLFEKRIPDGLRRWSLILK